MKKLLILSAVIISCVLSAMPFRSSCGIVFQINDNYVKNATPQALAHTLSQLNYSACGTVPKSITFYMSDGSTSTH